MHTTININVGGCGGGGDEEGDAKRLVQVATDKIK